MDISWLSAIAFLLFCILLVGLQILHRVKKLASHIEAVEVDRTYFTIKNREEIESLQADLFDLITLIKDLADFQKGNGTYRYDPNDPRLPNHIQDHEE